MKKMIGLLVCIGSLLLCSVPAFASETVYEKGCDGVAVPYTSVFEPYINSNGTFTFEFDSAYFNSTDTLTAKSSSITIKARATTEPPDSTGGKPYYISLYEVDSRGSSISGGYSKKISYTADGTDYTYTHSVVAGKYYRIQLSQPVATAGNVAFIGSGSISNVIVD